MRSAFRKYVNPATLLASVALLFAMGGGAYAASKYLITNTKQISPKVLKHLRGARGRNGANGANGATGPQGSTGPQGPAGAAGKDGTNGLNGSNGTSATTESFSGKAHGCEEGGVIVKSASPEAVVCNGKKGTTGFTKTLPSEQSEYGTWGTAFGPKEGEFAGAAGQAVVAISFDIPLAVAPGVAGCNEQPQPTSCQVHLIASSGKELISNAEFEVEEVTQRSPAPCPGSAATPEAEPGNLCVYIDKTRGVTLLSPGSLMSTPGGVVLPTLVSIYAGSYIDGSWAVTAE